MSTPVPLRSDLGTIGLRMLARRSRDPDQARRLLAAASHNHVCALLRSGGPELKSTHAHRLLCFISFD